MQSIETTQTETHVSTAQPAGPRISIVTPSYNQGRFLEDCIRSVLAQEHADLEYIVIDGGSTDGSQRILERYQDRLACWVSEPDGGQSDAINKGFRRASGELVAWLNADDFYLPGALATVAREYRANPAASFYFGDGLRVDEMGRTLSRFSPAGNHRFDRAALVHGLNYILQPATFINRRHLIAVDYLDAGLKYGLDTDLWLRLSAVAPPAPIADCLAASREYQTTKTASGSFARAEELRRIAEKHSGSPLTPGALCYYLDTLHRLTHQGSEVYPREFLSDVEWFWKVVRGFMARHGAGPDGFPLPHALEGRLGDEEAPAPGLVERLRAQLREARDEIHALRHRALSRRLFMRLSAIGRRFGR